MSQGANIIQLIADRQDRDQFRRKHWVGTFDEYLDIVNIASTLNDALDEMLTSSHGVVVVTGRRGAFKGVIRVETIMEAISELRNGAQSDGQQS